MKTKTNRQPKNKPSEIKLTITRPNMFETGSREGIFSNSSSKTNRKMTSKNLFFKFFHF